jgi:hypothetical protein
LEFAKFQAGVLCSCIELRGLTRSERPVTGSDGWFPSVLRDFVSCIFCQILAYNFTRLISIECTALCSMLMLTRAKASPEYDSNGGSVKLFLHSY